MFNLGKFVAGVLGATLLLAGTASAEALKYKFGRIVTDKEVAGWDISISPDGANLPEASGTVVQGEKLYQTKCAYCHGDFGEAVDRWPALMGGESSLKTLEPTKTIGSYWPYAPSVFSYIRRAMPFYNPQSLSDEETYAITAYVLYLNDLVGDDFEANQVTLPAIEMPNREGFFGPDPRPDVRNIACMKDCTPNQTQDLCEISIGGFMQECVDRQAQ
jgi:cytochrome c